jgi:hypothetical protein
LGVVFSFLHLVIICSGVADIVAAVCSPDCRLHFLLHTTVDSAEHIYCAFAAVVLAAVGLVNVIGA